MSEHDFFQEVEHPAVPWREYELHVPVFYRDIGFMSVSLSAPLEKLRALLPSPRLKPYRITPWSGTLSITTYEYRDCDIGPYNEVAVGIPVTLDQETPIFTGSLRKMPSPFYSYSHHLPVTTEIARVVGAEFAGYPKFVADIEFAQKGDWQSCKLEDGGQHVLTLSGRILDVVPAPRHRVHPITHRNGYLLRSELMLSERETGRSRDDQDVELELGDHAIAEELRELQVGKVLSYMYCPRAQAILTPVIESFAV